MEATSGSYLESPESTSAEGGHCCQIIPGACDTPPIRMFVHRLRSRYNKRLTDEQLVTLAAIEHLAPISEYRLYEELSFGLGELRGLVFDVLYRTLVELCPGFEEEVYVSTMTPRTKAQWHIALPLAEDTLDESDEPIAP